MFCDLDKRFGAACRSLVTELAARFTAVSEQLTANAEAIDAELIAVQGSPADIGGYYRPDATKASAVMRPSATFNGILAALA